MAAFHLLLLLLVPSSPHLPACWYFLVTVRFCYSTDISHDYFWSMQPCQSCLSVSFTSSPLQSIPSSLPALPILLSLHSSISFSILLLEWWSSVSIPFDISYWLLMCIEYFVDLYMCTRAINVSSFEWWPAWKTTAVIISSFTLGNYVYQTITIALQ